MVNRLLKAFTATVSRDANARALKTDIRSAVTNVGIKTGKTSTSDQYAAIDYGLDAPCNSDKSEGFSAIVTGSAGSYRKEAKVVCKKLKAQD